MRHEQPQQRPDDRIAHAPGVIREKRNGEKCLQGSEPHISGQHLQMIAQTDPGAARHYREQSRQESGYRECA
jgi:hypothetical protein